MLGSSYSFSCNADISSNIDADITYSLIRNEFTTADTTSLPVVTFNLLTLADAGAYSCLIEVTSPYINNPISETTAQEVLSFTSM